MHRFALAGAVLVGLAGGGVVPTVGSAQAFEGVIHFTIRDEDGKTTDIVQMTKAGKMRMSVIESGQESGIIVDSVAGSMTIINGKDKSYMVIPREMVERARGMTRGSRRPSTSGADGPKGKITRTGRTETVAGVRCEVYAYDGTDDGHHVTGEACLAKGVGMLFGRNMGMGMLGGEEPSAMQERVRNWGQIGALLAQGYGLLKATSYRDGKPSGSIEVTAVQRGAPSDAVFQPPAGYKQQSLMGGRSH